MRTYEQALELAARHGSRVLRGTVDMYVGRAALHRELGDLAAARRDLARSRELGEHAGLPQNAYRWRVVMAQVCEAEGDLEAAIGLLDEAERLYEGDFSPNVRPVPAVRARVWIRQGRVDDALDWAGRQGLSVDDDLSYLREFEHVTLARALVADHARSGTRSSLDQALDLLGRLLRAAEDGQPARLRDRDPGGGGAGAPAAGRPAERAGVPRGGPEPGGAGGLRPHVPRRGCTDGGPAGRGRRPRQRLAVRPPAPGRARGDPGAYDAGPHGPERWSSR